MHFAIDCRIMASWRIFFVCVVVQLIGFITFLKGFFPAKVVLEGFSKFDDLGSPFTAHGKAQFEKVILMVVDAMRSDFMFSEENSHMNFLHSLIEKGHAIPLTAYSHPPTVTLPRLKGITTGGAPSFVDAILNVADDKDDSQGLSNTDSWIYQFKNKDQGKVLHFYGDDTWLKLFSPVDFFEKYEGTNSFFVSDFTEVDLNVTKHLNSEMNDTEWDGLILHYLGLDHIGHKGGPYSVFMKPKQEEMDEVLKTIYESRLEGNDNTLMILMGDHGMNDIGNHGGSSSGETHPGLTFISPKFSKIRKERSFPFIDKGNYEYFSMISQIDLVPSLSALLNFPIPKNNLGIMIPEILELWEELDRKAILLENCKQLMTLLEHKFSKDSNELQSFTLALSILRGSTQIGTEQYFSFLREAQELLTESAINYSYYDIGLGFALIIISVLVFSGQLAYQLKEERSAKNTTLTFCFCSLLYSLHFHGSSLIEEEHQLWWFFTIIFFSALLLSFKSICFSRVIVCLIGIRVLRAWNNSGQKFHTSWTISTFILNKPELLWALNILTYGMVIWLLISRKEWQQSFAFRHTRVTSHKNNVPPSLLSIGVACLLGFFSLAFKILQYSNDGNVLPKWILSLIDSPFFPLKFDLDDKMKMQKFNVELSRIFFFLLISTLFLRILVGKARKLNQSLITDLLNLSCILLMHQSRTEVIPVFLVLGLIRHNFRSLLRRSIALSMYTRILTITGFILCMQNLSFFSIGNTNLLATVDLSNAYNGVREFDVFLVAFMTFISNYAVVIFWSLSGIELIHDSIVSLNLTQCKREGRILIFLRSELMMLFYSLSMVNLVGSCINLRFHLFIWSVFSPKLLYFSSWVLLVNLLIDLLLSSVLIAL